VGLLDDSAVTLLNRYLAHDQIVAINTLEDADHFAQRRLGLGADHQPLMIHRDRSLGLLPKELQRLVREPELKSFDAMSSTWTMTNKEDPAPLSSAHDALHPVTL
jgi:hypothetical protein